MKRLRPLVWTALMFFANALFGMNNEDVIKMVNADLGEDTIVVAIQSAETADFDTSTDALIELKSNKVSEAIIQAMLKRANGGDEQAGAASGGITFTDVPLDEVSPPEVDPVPGETYFTRYNMKYEKGQRLATNYWRGDFVPINSRVVYAGSKGDRITLKVVDSGDEIVIRNVPKFTARSVEELLREMLAAAPTEIEKYGEEMARAIRTGTLRLGMNKAQVLMTRGYPPSHETPSLDSDSWKYWSSRFVVQTLVFDHDILVEGRGIR